MADILTNCDGRLLWRCLDGKPVVRTGAFPFLCPKCGASGLASRLRTVCGLPVAKDGSDGAWMEWTEGSATINSPTVFAPSRLHEHDVRGEMDTSAEWPVLRMDGYDRA